MRNARFFTRTPTFISARNRKRAIMAYTLDQFAADCRAALLKLPNSITSAAHGSPTALLSQATSATSPARLEQISSGPASPSPSIGRASSTLYRLTGWTSIPGVPATTARAFVGCAVSALNRPPLGTSIPCPMTVAVAVAGRWIILSVGRCERFNRDN